MRLGRSCLDKIVLAPNRGVYLLISDREVPGFNRFLGSTENFPLVSLVLELFPSLIVFAVRSFFISFPHHIMARGEYSLTQQ